MYASSHYWFTALQTLHPGSLEILLTVPLGKNTPNVRLRLQPKKGEHGLTKSLARTVKLQQSDYKTNKNTSL